MSGRSLKESLIRDINIIDMILIDHRYIKDSIEILMSENADKIHKLEVANGFLTALHKHTTAENKIVYTELKEDDDFHFNILQSEIEHDIFEQKIKQLKPKVSHAKTINDEIEAELKVLAGLVKNHIKEEESELLPKMNELLGEESLRTMGLDFMKTRGMKMADLERYPTLQDELIYWKDDVQKISSQFLTKIEKCVENLKH